MTPTTLAKNSYVDVSDLVTLTYLGPKPFSSWTYESREYVCEKDKRIYVPFYLVVNEFGDPRSQPDRGQVITIRGAKHFIPNRQSELARLCTRYGIMRVDGEGLSAVSPKVLIEDQSGQQIKTVLDDYTGHDFLPASPEQISERDLLEGRLQQIQSQLDALKDNKEPVDPSMEEDVDEDEPPNYSSAFRT